MKHLEIAFEHVKETFPTLDMILFNSLGQWCYMDMDFNPFNFEGTDIDQEILDNVEYDLKELPFVYRPYENLYMCNSCHSHFNSDDIKTDEDGDDYCFTCK